MRGFCFDNFLNLASKRSSLVIYCKCAFCVTAAIFMSIKFGKGEALNDKSLRDKTNGLDHSKLNFILFFIKKALAAFIL